MCLDAIAFRHLKLHINEMWLLGRLKNHSRVALRSMNVLQMISSSWHVLGTLTRNASNGFGGLIINPNAQIYWCWKCDMANLWSFVNDDCISDQNSFKIDCPAQAVNSSFVVARAVELDKEMPKHCHTGLSTKCFQRLQCGSTFTSFLLRRFHGKTWSMLMFALQCPIWVSATLFNSIESLKKQATFLDKSFITPAGPDSTHNFE